MNIKEINNFRLNKKLKLEYNTFNYIYYLQFYYQLSENDIFEYAVYYVVLNNNYFISYKNTLFGSWKIELV